MASEPNPCPACRSNPPDVSIFWHDCEDATDRFNHYDVLCNDCGFVVHGGSTEEEAISEWNEISKERRK